MISAIYRLIVTRHAAKQAVKYHNMFAVARRFCRYQVDAGWAWVVCVASFFVQGVIFGTIQSFGTLFIALLNDFKSGESATGELCCAEQF